MHHTPGAATGFLWPQSCDHLTLNHLNRYQTASIVTRLNGDKALPADVTNQILTKTDGIPLFLEELTKTIVESGLVRGLDNSSGLSGPPPSFAIPSSLHDSLMARLDRLGHVKELAQTAAVIGREFSHGVLSAVSPLPEVVLRGALDRLGRPS